MAVAKNSNLPPTTQVMLAAPWNVVGRFAWWIIAATAILVLVASIPAYVSQMGVMTEFELVSLQNVLPEGASAAFFAPYEMTVDIIVTIENFVVSLLSIGLGLLIYRRRPGELITLLTSGFLLAYGFILTGPLENLVGNLAGYVDVINVAQLVLLLAGFTLLMLLFPDGRFAVRWTRWLALLLLPIIIFFILIAPGLSQVDPNSPVGAVTLMMIMAVPATSVGTQIYRYRRLATPAQRQQIKWVMLGAIGFVASYSITIVFFAGRPLWAPAETWVVVSVLTILRLNWWLGLTFIPVSIALAVLRYRLWDLDFIINRSLVYGLLTVILLAVLGGGFFAIRAGLGAALGGEQSTIAIVGATAIVVGVFNPARRGLRHFVDQRLYGIKVDYTPGGKPALSSVAAPRSTLGNYEGLELIGRGGMAEVYKATHPTLKRPVAIKVLPHAMAQDEDFRKRFEREARTVAALKHPNIVQMFDFGEADGTAFMVIEYIGGPDVGDALKGGAMPLERALPIAHDIAGALDYAHQQGLVHRDIKPSNVMLDPITATGKNARTERAVLTDFGIARILSGKTHLTASGMIGTLDYMSPEQIKDAKDVDGRADIYSLGVMLFQMLTGRLPFTASNPGALLIAHLNQPAPDPRSLRADIPEDVAEATLRALEKDPARRFQTAGEFAAALA